VLEVEGAEEVLEPEEPEEGALVIEDEPEPETEADGVTLRDVDTTLAVDFAPETLEVEERLEEGAAEIAKELVLE